MKARAWRVVVGFGAAAALWGCGGALTEGEADETGGTGARSAGGTGARSAGGTGSLDAGGTNGTIGGTEPGGGTTGSSGASGRASGGSGGEPRSSNLLTAEVLASGWIGGDPSSTSDNPVGLQGEIYGYGDDIACVVAEGNPCTSSGCCINYTTIVDATYAAWGCGIGVALNSSGGIPGTKGPYAGPAIGFRIATSNTGMAAVRIHYAQSADLDGQVSPFVFSAGGVETVGFTDVSCPSWAYAGQCPPPTSTPYDLQIQVVGGDYATSGTLCLTELSPI